MPTITVQVSNPNDMKLVVTTEMTLAQWKRLAEAATKAPYYAPLADLLSAINGAISAIENRECVTYKAPLPQDHEQ